MEEVVSSNLTRSTRTFQRVPPKNIIEAERRGVQVVSAELWRPPCGAILTSVVHDRDAGVPRCSWTGTWVTVEADPACTSLGTGRQFKARVVFVLRISVDPTAAVVRGKKRRPSEAPRPAEADIE